MNRAPLDRPAAARRAGSVASCLLVLALLAPGSVWAEAQSAPPVSLPSAPVQATPQKPPALDLSAPRPEPRPVIKQWWFWTAVGTVVAATAIVLVLANRKDGPPATTLGNQEFTP